MSLSFLATVFLINPQLITSKSCRKASKCQVRWHFLTTYVIENKPKKTHELIFIFHIFSWMTKNTLQNQEMNQKAPLNFQKPRENPIQRQVLCSKWKHKEYMNTWPNYPVAELPCFFLSRALPPRIMFSCLSCMTRTPCESNHKTEEDR